MADTLPDWATDDSIPLTKAPTPAPIQAPKLTRPAPNTPDLSPAVPGAFITKAGNNDPLATTNARIVDYTPGQYAQLKSLVAKPDTTEKQLMDWFNYVDPYNKPTNIAEILAFHKNHKHTLPNTSYQTNEAPHDYKPADTQPVTPIKNDGTFMDDVHRIDQAVKDGQGGWGISDNTRKALTAEGGIPAINGLPADIVDGIYRLYQSAVGAGHVTLENMDDVSKKTGIADALSWEGNKFLPGSAIGALSEAFPLGGAETGIMPHPTVKGKEPVAAAEDAPVFRPALLQTDGSLHVGKVGGSHFDIIEKQPESFLHTIAPEGEGFVDQKGKYYTRTEAAQALPDKAKNDLLYAEDLPSTEDALPATPQFQGDVVTRLTDALNNAGKVSKEQAALLSASRSEKLSLVNQARNETSGEGGLSAELAGLKGETKQAVSQPVRGAFSQDEIDGLFNTIKDHPNLGVWESIRARQGLTKVLDGEVPQAGEISLLSRVFPSDLIEAAVKNRNNKTKLADFLGNALNTPRTLMSTFDLSAPLRQGVFLVGSPEFYKAFPAMFKEFASAFQKNDGIPVSERPSNWKSSGSAVLDEIRSRPSYDLMDRAGLAITEPYGHNLATREEQFMSNWAEKIPVAGRIVKASEKGYAGFLNKLRADTFDSLVQKSYDAGVDFKSDPKALKDIAKFINSATGRGDLGALNSAAPILNSLFFSPRLIKSRVDLLNPQFYASLSPVVRTEAIKSLLKFGGLATTVIALFKAGGADVEDDPRSSDFGKIRDGNTRYDVLGGFGQYLTFAARMATNQSKTMSGNVNELGKKYGSDTRYDITDKFLTNKFAPVPGYVRDWMKGADPVGNKFDPANNAAKLFMPLFLQDAYGIYQDQGAAALPKAIPGFFGVGIQTFQDKKSGPKPVPSNLPLPDWAKDPSAAITPTTAPAPAAPAAPVSKAKTEVVPLPDWAKEPVPQAPTKQASLIPAASAAVLEGVPDWAKTDNPAAKNMRAAYALENLGLHITDSGIRSEAAQEKYYATTKGVAKPGTSPHQAGNALDVRIPTGTEPSEIVTTLEKEGYKNVRVITRRHGTGPHWHVQWDAE